jgi:hypothetical protein
MDIAKDIESRNDSIAKDIESRNDSKKVTLRLIKTIL